MEIYHSTAHMLDELPKNGWAKDELRRGFTLIPHIDIGVGQIIVWGDPMTLCLLDMDITFNTPQFMLNYSNECGVQITFIEQIGMEYYKDESEIETGHFGNFAYVNNVCIPWFKKYPVGERTKALTLMVSDEFLKEENIHLSKEDWNRFARGINGRNASIPAVTSILKQIRQATISNELFERYFKTKAIEAFLLLWDYARKKEKTDLKRLNNKSHIAVKETIHILDNSFISPPIITDLAKMVGVDKKTLQFAFKEIVGLSIHKYTRTLKMQKALLLLEDRRMNIEDISKAVGYQSKIHFYRAFEKVFSIKPLEMKKLLTNPLSQARGQ